MMASTPARFVMAAILLITLASGATSSEITTVSTHEEGRDKKMDKMMKDMYLAFMLAKNMIGMLLMFVSPIIQIKGFGLSVINTLVNIGRFFLQMEATKSAKTAHIPPKYFVSLNHHPVHHPIHHPIHLPIHHHPTPTPQMIPHPETEEQLQPADQDEQYIYYAPPPPEAESSWDSGYNELTKNMPVTHASYISNSYENRVYPFFNHNNSRFR